MKYALVSTKPSIFDFVLIVLGLVLVLFFFIDSLDLFIVLCILAILIGLMYRVYEYFFKAYPIEIETTEKDIIIRYDKGEERRIPYSLIKNVELIEDEIKNYHHLLIYVSSPLNEYNVNKNRYKRTLAIPTDSSEKLMKDIKSKLSFPTQKKIS